MKLSHLSHVLTVLRSALGLLPASFSISLLKISRSAFSIRLNGILEEQIFSPLLKGNPATLPLLRLFVPVVIERQMTIRVGDESQRNYWVGHFDEVAGYIHRHLGAEDTFIDIGANCGFMSLVASAHIPASQIHCFEPNPDTFAELTNNLRINALVANTYNLALSDKKDRCRLFVPDGACGGSSIEAKNYQRRDLLPGEKLPTAFHEVDAERFDDLWKTISPKTPLSTGNIVIKLDAEGFEMTIISGMTEFLKTYASRITLLIEVYDSEYDDAVSKLSALGFTCHHILMDGGIASAERPGTNRFRNYCFKTLLWSAPTP